MKFLKQILAAGFAFAMAHSANASIISVNGTEVEALDLNGSYKSFLDFYDYNTVNRFTSNTGLEQADSIVMFFAELNNEFSFFTLVSGPLGGRGAATADISGTEGTLSFVDDPADQTGNQVNWTYDQRRGDGLIYSGLSNGSWLLNTSFSQLTNIDSFEVLTFSGGDFANATSALSGNDTEYTAISSGSSIVQVSEPSTLAFVGALLLSVSLIRRRA